VQLDSMNPATTTLSLDGSKNLIVNGHGCGSSTPSDISLSVASGAPMQTVVLGQTGAGGVFPCTMPVDGTLRASDIVEVDAASGESVSLGQTASGTGVNPNSCSTVGTITGLGSYTVLGSGTSTLSAAGGTGFVAGLNKPATLSASTDGANTFLRGLAPDTIDFSRLGVPLLFNDTTGPVGPAASRTATTSSFTYTFTSFSGASAASTVIGSGGGSSFYAGGGDFTFQGQGLSSDTLSFADATGSSVTICAGTGGTCSAAGTAFLNGQPTQFSGIPIFDSLEAGNTTFIADSTGGETFTATGAGNLLAAFSAPTGAVIDVAQGQLTGLNGPDGTDNFSGIAAFEGSSSGITTFKAANASATFSNSADADGDVLDLSNLPTSNSTQLSVNVSGHPLPQATNTAVVGTTTITLGNNAAKVASFVGSSSGFTVFHGDSEGGQSFAGQGTQNTFDLSYASSGIEVDVPEGLVKGLSAANDDFSGITTFDGSGQGATTFDAASTGGYTFNGNFGGPNNILDLTAAPPGATFDAASNGTVSGLSGGEPDGYVNIQFFRKAVTFTSAAPLTAGIGDTYPPTTQGDGASSPVVVSIDAATTNSACSIDGDGTVHFDHAGNCVIDADQAAQGVYAAAPTASQQVSVGLASETAAVTVQPTTITATLTPLAPTTEFPTGIVDFYVNGVYTGHAVLNNGVAVRTHTVPSGGHRTVSISYPGDGDFFGTTAQVHRYDPTITAKVSSKSAKTKYGWYRHPVTVTFTCGTTTAPLVGSCPAAVTVSSSDAKQLVTRTVHATDGGAATARVGPINLDRKAPTIKVKGVKAGATYSKNPTPTFVFRDGLSGIAGSRHSLSHHRKGQYLVYKYAATATDRAGNPTTVTGSYRVHR